MIEHILKKSHEELEYTHNLVENYKISGVKELFFNLVWKSFKKMLFDYVHKKEEILMNYSSLYSDFLKDINDSHASPTDIDHVRESILYITDSIATCWKILENLIAHTHMQEEILDHEKSFFAWLLESFNNDLIAWTQKHEQEIFWEISKIEIEAGKTPLESGRALLELQKKRLESHIQNIHNLDQNGK